MMRLIAGSMLLCGVLLCTGCPEPKPTDKDKDAKKAPMEKDKAAPAPMEKDKAAPAEKEKA
jgi:PBP1b-binding outer membrane lipoprotein LpoB